MDKFDVSPPIMVIYFKKELKIYFLNVARLCLPSSMIMILILQTRQGLVGLEKSSKYVLV